MKKFFTLVLVGMVLSLAFTACKSTKAPCDAYGSANQTENADFASK